MASRKKAPAEYLVILNDELVDRRFTSEKEALDAAKEDLLYYGLNQGGNSIEVFKRVKNAILEVRLVDQ